MLDYWRQQDKKALFENLMWSKPGSITASSTIGLIGGSKTSFLALSKAYQTLQNQKINIKLVVPDSLKPTLTQISQTEFVTSNQSGSIGKNAHKIMLKLAQDSDACLLIGDAGKNSQTQAEYELFAKDFPQDKQLIIARDAIDLVLEIINQLISQSNLTLIVSFSQLQAIFRKLYYPILLTHSIQVSKLVEALHKFSLTYPSTIVLLWQNQLFIAQNGQIVSTTNFKQTDIWQGILPANLAAWISWFPSKKLEAISCATFEKRQHQKRS